MDSDALTMTKQMDQVHDSFASEITDITADTVAELEYATDTTVPKGWNTSSNRSKKSKNRNKSRRSKIESSDKGWSVLC